MIMCNAAFGIFFIFLHRSGVNYIDHFLWTASYFLFIAIITSLLFWSYIVTALHGFTATPFIVLWIFMLAQVILYIHLPRYLREPKEYFEKYPDRYYLKIDWKRLISKSMDIVAQQVFIVLLVTFLKDAGLSLPEIIFSFTFLFALLHIPLIASEWGAWPSWLFGGIVIVFSIIFPILILKVQYGFIYNIIIHWLFYTVTAVIFWIWSAKQTNSTHYPRIF